MIEGLSVKVHHPDEGKEALVILVMMRLLDMYSIIRGKTHEMF